MYTSALVIQTGDAFVFFTLSPVFFPEAARADLAISPAGRFFTRCTGTVLFPFVLLGYLLRHHHIRRTEVGRALGACFTLYHAGCLAMYSWSRLVEGEYGLEWAFAPVVGVHTAWAVWGLYGLLAA
ncbi:hypothetical protein BGW36DRAFT_15922 [Talaromyces proteolyticus]|uniref:Uncharacterized protein n=1 Tax=Talaromyces proteolyticus TaxID=1131652 RepID=A0AAD4L452_9EURO|nr:uncharacterized protein BGW36DRAFT_15922 [Talaromyces proteolyticus]KAH8705607.1 hypothetical protein BGW36DRAFT_15922 [Talaromyces proteolyticus]